MRKYKDIRDCVKVQEIIKRRLVPYKLKKDEYTVTVKNNIMNILVVGHRLFPSTKLSCEMQLLSPPYDEPNKYAEGRMLDSLCSRLRSMHINMYNKNNIKLLDLVKYDDHIYRVFDHIMYHGRLKHVILMDKDEWLSIEGVKSGCPYLALVDTDNVERVEGAEKT